MSNIDTRCLDAFPGWLEQLAPDALALVGCLKGSALEGRARVRIVGGLNYLLKSVDLIPDGVEELGYIDDAFVLRACAADAAEPLDEPPETLSRLARDMTLIEEFLEGDAGRLRAYAAELIDLEVRGRTPQTITADDVTRDEFVSDVQAWANSYRVPTFSRDEKNLVKLRSFLRTKLPSPTPQSQLPGL